MSSGERLISRIPGEGASVVPIIGRELLGYNPDTYVPEGIQSVIGVGFRSKWTWRAIINSVANNRCSRGGWRGTSGITI